jgi:hypothetical protein
MVPSRPYQSGDQLAIHIYPVWGESADSRILAYVDEDQGSPRWEEIFAEKIGALRFKVCCIPFLVYDLALGDEVETDADLAITKVMTGSGHWTFRVWFGDSPRQEIKAEVLDECYRIGVGFEWQSDDMVAISAPDAVLGQLVADYLWDLEQKSELVYETGRSCE